MYVKLNDYAEQRSVLIVPQHVKKSYVRMEPAVHKTLRYNSRIYFYLSFRGYKLN
jgi:hypothetical protein